MKRSHLTYLALAGATWLALRLLAVHNELAASVHAAALGTIGGLIRYTINDIDVSSAREMIRTIADASSIVGVFLRLASWFWPPRPRERETGSTSR
jgi:hypothetical protein